ncbi:hypothetical protein F4775DRAFT_536140 [Biscogniauxia sp. FL1348]|nr:hypothetical protein F4775DRAFT_536140 [Biscogniauxia sp. FL1348]
MTEGVQAPEDAAAARAAEQARLRKERREAKIKAGGAARLNKITGLGGGIQRDPQPQPVSESAAPQPTTTASPSPAPKPTPATSDQHADPEEVDISQHYYEPKTTSRPSTGDAPDISEAQLRQMMLGLDRPASAGTGQLPMPGMEGMEGMQGMQDDPMMQMLSQMMGGGMPGAAGPGGANPFAGTGMEGLFGAGGNPFQQQQQQQQVQQSSKTANLWRILHAIFALGLGLYVALATTFSGTQAEREHDSVIQASGLLGDNHSVEQTRAYFFYIFTSVEAVLLTTRFFMDAAREPPSGWLWTISGFLPDPAKGYLRHALRYGQIFSTVRNDALFCVFVMGVCCLLRT